MKTRVPPPVWMLAIGAVMWFVSRSAYAYPIDIPYALVVAIVIGLLGIACSVAGIREFRKVSTTVNPLQPDEASTLVTTGIFKATRNPMYVGLFLILAGWAVWLGSLASVPLLLVFLLVMTELQIKPEEQAMQALFGQDYEDYRGRVRRWI